MKALVQRVSQASVSIDERIVSSIQKGLVVLVGVAGNDSEDDASYLSGKIANLRIFSDDSGKFNLSALDINAEILLVSQFTLFASTRKGRRPSFTEAAPPEKAENLIDRLADLLLSTGLRVETGRFQEHMMVEIHNDGPVTILIDSSERFQPRHS